MLTPLAPAAYGCTAIGAAGDPQAPLFARLDFGSAFTAIYSWVFLHGSRPKSLSTRTLILSSGAANLELQKTGLNSTDACKQIALLCLIIKHKCTVTVYKISIKVHLIDLIGIIVPI